MKVRTLFTVVLSTRFVTQNTSAIESWLNQYAGKMANGRFSLSFEMFDYAWCLEVHNECNFHFIDPKIAALFKLTWYG